ncbi:MAG: alpha/beta hydrolase, partial [Candidatus Solibacter sp.]|nr:alpha/beta hydrolase [Candidatus Solibacter sp.]
CAEDLPFLDDAAIAREAASTFLGDLRVQRQRAACRECVRGAVAPDVHEPDRSAVPILLPSGGRDPVTPPAFAERVAASLSNARHIVFPESAHGNLGQCRREILASFIASGDPAALNAACAQVK